VLRLTLVVAGVVSAIGPLPQAQSDRGQARQATPTPPAAEELPLALTRMVGTERTFAARALAVGWKEAFLEFFADNAIGFEAKAAGSAKQQIRANPDPPPGMQLLWEPRYGDVAASGELGYLTGPAQTIVPSRNNGRPRHSTFFSLWRRQRNGSFAVVMDVGNPTPRAVPFAPGFTRAPHANRFTGDYDENTPPLSAADSVLNSALSISQAAAYRDRLAPGVRVHRHDGMPLVGERPVRNWLASQPSYAAADTRFSDAAQSGDMGYTWGTYIIGARGSARREEGFYVRVWVRERNGQWKVAADITQPQ